MSILGTFDYQRLLREPFHHRKELLQAGSQCQRLVKAGRAHAMGPACPPPCCVAGRGGWGTGGQVMRAQGSLLAATPRDAFTVCLS